VAGLLDVILGYERNLACDCCTITEMRRQELGTAAVLGALRRGRSLDYDRVSFTGGGLPENPQELGLCLRRSLAVSHRGDLIRSTSY